MGTYKMLMNKLPYDLVNIVMEYVYEEDKSIRNNFKYQIDILCNIMYNLDNEFGIIEIYGVKKIIRCANIYNQFDNEELYNVYSLEDWVENFFN